MNILLIIIACITTLLAGYFLYRFLTLKKEHLKPEKSLTSSNELLNTLKVVQEMRGDRSKPPIALWVYDLIKAYEMESQNYFSSYFSDFFILNKPKKDNLGADSFFIKQHKNSLLFGIMDGLGFGFSGMVLSLFTKNLIYDSLSDSKKERFLSELVSSLSRKLLKINHNRPNYSYYSFDFAFFRQKHNSNWIEFVHSRNIIFFLYSENELTQIKGTHIFLGFQSKNSNQNLENNVLDVATKSISVKKGDILYLATDGYQDQLGGEEGKKFMRKNFQKLISEIAHKLLQEQKEILEETHHTWKGEEEQTDDILMVALKI